METDQQPSGNVRTRTTLVVITVATVLTMMAALLGAGVLAVAATSAVQNSRAWEEWAHVGDSFGVLNSVLSGMAFVALVVTLWVQYHELSLQRHELHLQRDAIERSSEELRRSADAGLRMLHFELLKMSIDDPALASVWPDPVEDVDPERRRQLIYANLVFQHVSLSMMVARYSDDEIKSVLHYLFTSELMRDYWVTTAAARQRIQVPGTDAWRISRLGDEVINQQEADGSPS